MSPSQRPSPASPGGRARSRQARRRRHLWTAAGMAAALLLALTLLGLAGGQQIRRDTFEGRDPAWVKGPADAGYRELAHQMTEDTAHRGQRCEALRLEAE